MKIKDILKVKGSQVWTISATQTVREALELLVRRNIGALVVTDEGRGHILGIISERDLVRACHDNIEAIASKQVFELMTRKIIVASLDDEVETLMSTMTDKRVRHIPVMSEGRLAGIVSIGDVVKSMLKDSAHQIQYLKEFMYGPTVPAV